MSKETTSPCPALETILKQSIKRQEAIEFPLNNLPANLAWTFSHLTTKDTSYLSHGYHRYPAKFIPQLTRKIIEIYSSPRSLICDPFMGSGTTILEGLLTGRRVIGTDINPVAVLITQAKLRPLQPDYLKERCATLLQEIRWQVAEEVKGQLPLSENLTKAAYTSPTNDRLVYWFPATEIRQELAIILAHINRLEDVHLKQFCLCAFSQILKNTSIWLNKSTKPTREFTKKIPSPLNAFQKHLQKMINRNRQLYFILDPITYERLDEYAQSQLSDARCQPAEAESVELVVTSPPYVTSYEYADLHQLTALWLSYTNSLSEFRQPFIGSAYKRHSHNQLLSPMAEATIEQLGKKSLPLAKSVKSYFLEMQECFREMQRILRKEGKAAIVIGNTALKGVPILNAEIFIETMWEMNFKIYDIIKRIIPGKILPQTRDQKTGRFAAKKISDVYAYPHEFIVVMEKK